MSHTRKAARPQSNNNNNRRVEKMKQNCQSTG